MKKASLGLFETMRAYRGKILYLDRHLSRLEKSCRITGLKLPYSPDKLTGLIYKKVGLSSLKDARVKLTLRNSGGGKDISISIKKYRPFSAQKYKKGFQALVSSLRQDENSLFIRHKTTSRIIYELSFKEARAKGFDEAILLNRRGNIAEATRSNIFLAKDKTILTPALRCGCLDGITRRVIFDLAKKSGIKIRRRNISLGDLYAADEAFLTNSLMGVMPLAAVGRNKIGKGTPGSLTEYFSKRYNLLLRKCALKN